MIKEINGVFKLDTPQTTYIFRITPEGHAEHLYYGPYLPETGDAAAYDTCMRLRMPTIVNYSDDSPRTYLTMLPMELSSHGKGDLREVAFTGELGEQGNTVFDFTYDSFRMEGPDFAPAPYLPSASKEDSETLVVTMRDKVTGVAVELIYTVYPESDVITRRSVVLNGSRVELTVRSLASLQLDMADEGFEAVTFDGAWIREREMHVTPLYGGMLSISSSAGVSSAEHNPLFMLRHGEECYMFNLIWSGDHKESAEVSPYGTVRVMTGINPATFSLKVAPGERFVTPEALMLYSPSGMNGASQTAHAFINSRISPQAWRNRVRPVLLNSWEGMGFHMNEENIRRQADKALELGCELFVIDDGWFRKGFQAKGYMGDWAVAENKFPRGLKCVCDYIHSVGMMAGIWIEPEMISPDTVLYREHPELLVSCPGRDPSPGRDQYLLDMTNRVAVDMIFEKLETLIADNGFDYVKSDLNRYLADDCSHGNWTPEFRYRWTLGVYALFGRLRARFPQLLIEGCASGGGRFDLGILNYVNQFWGSDNTDATDRVSIFGGTVCGYPQCIFGAHVSRIPNGITGRIYDYETAFNVNAFGAFGYELDVTKLSSDEESMFAAQIAFYKKYRTIFQFGKFTKVSDGNEVIWTAENEDASVLVAMYLEKRMTLSQQKVRRLLVPGCRKDAMYTVTARRQTVTSPEMCSRRGSVHLSPEFTLTAPGALLSGHGVALMPVFLGTEYREDVWYPGDWGSMIFVIEQIRSH